MAQWISTTNSQCIFYYDVENYYDPNTDINLDATSGSIQRPLELRTQQSVEITFEPTDACLSFFQWLPQEVRKSATTFSLRFQSFSPDRVWIRIISMMTATIWINRIAKVFLRSFWHGPLGPLVGRPRARRRRERIYWRIQMEWSQRSPQNNTW